ncbi:MAG: methyltransferase [Candidatus Xenobia bacterium]
MKQRPGVRPTTGKVREALRSILQDIYPGAVVADLFAGTGALGADALDGGAARVDFVERDRPQAIKLRSLGRVATGRLPQALEVLEGPYDLILADPPYGSPDGPATVALLGPLLKTGGLVVVEHHHKDAYPDELGDLRLEKRRRYGETAISFYRPAEFTSQP